MSTANELGPLVRRWGLPVKQLPTAAAGIDELKPFVSSILKEALPFIDSAAPKTPDAKRLWKSKGGKSSPESTAKVEVLERAVAQWGYSPMLFLYHPIKVHTYRSAMAVRQGTRFRHGQSRYARSAVHLAGIHTYILGASYETSFTVQTSGVSSVRPVSVSVGSRLLVRLVLISPRTICVLYSMRVDILFEYYYSGFRSFFYLVPRSILHI
ncbi:hypothetical protein NUW58_g6828 [Xylaria curta]|uniref:Uncharacterized protein n=1 Tax=Xylaria curta TaxID=42375 RepID=A0ACC1NNN0_9PEZI|nr:hypothetical protein NUW58_g6828 [Xylaria curta]